MFEGSGDSVSGQNIGSQHWRRVTCRLNFEEYLPVLSRTVVLGEVVKSGRQPSEIQRGAIATDTFLNCRYGALAGQTDDTCSHVRSNVVASFAPFPVASCELLSPCSLVKN
jgi:hypothetical protein